MRWKSRQKKIGDWHPHFCLLPRKIGDYWVWLEYVQRCLTGYTLTSRGFFPRYTYSFVEDDDTDETIS
jgi:hypothetical protein